MSARKERRPNPVQDVSDDQNGPISGHASDNALRMLEGYCLTKAASFLRLAPAGRILADLVGPCVLACRLVCVPGRPLVQNFGGINDAPADAVESRTAAMNA